MSYFWIALGSAAGGVTRAWAVAWFIRRFDLAQFWGTLAVNVTGSFLVGLLSAWLVEDSGANSRAGSAINSLLLIGFCGGYTTFSAFSLQTLQLLREDKWPMVMANVIASVFGCLLAVGLGYVIGRTFNR